MVRRGKTRRLFVEALGFALATLIVIPLPATAETPRGIDVREALRREIESDWIERDRQFRAADTAPADLTRANVAGVTTQQDAAGGCDGVKNGKWGFHVASGQQDPWWQVDLGRSLRLHRVVVFNRTDRGTAARTRDLRVLVADTADGTFRELYRHDGTPFLGVEANKPLVVDLKSNDVSARIVRLAVPGQCSFALDEIEVYGVDDPAKNIALNKPADQISVSQYSYPGTLGHAVAVQPDPIGGGFALAHTRHVVAQAKQLLARIGPTFAPDRQQSFTRRLHQVDDQLASLSAAEQTSLEARRSLYLQTRWLKRDVALSNPRLRDIDRLLFIKRHDPVGIYHMCDQYYGCNAVAGGSLCVLEDPFGPEPKLVDLLADSVVEQGRLEGKKLVGGFLSPEVSFDGQTILFAHSEAKAKETYRWSPEFSYHLFRCNADGSNLVQLTDGDADDFDPCFLPGGRVAFVSLRRGGYLRCGRHCPVYTLHSMNTDGSDIIRLSHHETHEWHPSVDNDGMLVYTRWDYVDRDTNVAHHIWTCYPDGRDPRSLHGNYPQRRESRPWMEMSIRAVPGSPKYVATAAAHHGHAFGSLVLIDPRKSDDGAMSQLERLTPEVPFPEAEGGKGGIRACQAYGTPWPLGEDDYLCAYDPQATHHALYWIDRFGNKELIYRDARIPCISPMPLTARPTPPVIPDRTVQADAAAPPATVAVMNVYDADFDWPAGTKIDALRIIQVLPKSTAPPNEPRIGVANQTNARAVLGAVPVESDGSVFFEAPAGVPIYFQAVDADGLAVQSMRSATYLHPGERLTCVGCHEYKRRSQQLPDRVPLALLREPSKIEADVDGSNPFNYVRLVQPVLDRHCVECHQQRKAVDLTGAIEGPHGWTRSYTNLAGSYGFYFHVSNGSINQGVHGGSRTIAGQFGARASKLLEYLDARHYDVQLSPEERHRITLWLDCNSEFFGSYENTPAQSRGEIVKPTLE